MALTGLLDRFKLEKLTIEAYKKVDRGLLNRVGSMEAMFNPTSREETHVVKYAAPQAINAAGREADYALTPPGQFSFKLVFDGTGVSFFGAEHLARTLRGKTVQKEIDEFKRLCFEMNGEIHQPNYLLLRWGKWVRTCLLASVTIRYTRFDRGGEPLHAELDAKFIEDESEESLALKAARSSPDLTHMRVAKASDTLPLLCKEIYGDSRHYLRVAADNGLDDFRNLVPGQKLRFRPLDS
jgi:nucleoid-associated protein YgaU